MTEAWVGVDSTPYHKAETGSSSWYHLLWGDRVEVLHRKAARSRVRARSRNLQGWVRNEHLEGAPLLELYFIDVGQGDGVLIVTPDRRHVLIDGGYPRQAQNTGKSGADFVDWKFHEDYRTDEIRLEAMIASHCDYDHYGGLWDLLNVAESDELDCERVRVRDLFHAGIGWWRKPGGGRWLGPYDAAEQLFTQLVGDRTQVQAALASGADPELQGRWSDFLQAVVDARWTNGQPTRIRRLSHVDAHVPGFEPAAGQPSLAVLAPVEFELGGQPAIRRFTGGDDKNTNGNSLLLRLDFDRVRILLTGDLNKKSQRALLEDYRGQSFEFLCDVAKACHHGSDDVSFEFLQAMRPAVTVISSGDNEGHDHPRPSIVAASGLTGHLQIHDDEVVTPLIYSTELARSVSLGEPYEVSWKDAAGAAASLTGARFEQARIHYELTQPGGLAPEKKSRRLGSSYVVAGLVYGLVNVRTDGERILCATRNERDGGWEIHKLTSRF